jgi:hypothetical protein
VSRVGERGPTELVTEEAFKELEEAMKRGEIATIALRLIGSSWRGECTMLIPRASGGLLRRRKVKLKTGRLRHEKANKEEQEAFKKVRREGRRRRRSQRRARVL